MYATPIQHTTSAGMGEGVTCILRSVGMFFLWRAIPFICDELHLSEIAATGFAEEMQCTIDKSM